MAIPFFNIFGKQSYQKMAVFTGFERVYPVRNPGDSERFGVIELAPQPGQANRLGGLFGLGKQRETVYTGVLRLGGPTLNQWLGQDKNAGTFYESLCKNLPVDSQVQFLLRRRNLRLESHYNSLQESVLQRVGDEEVAGFFLQEYLDHLVYPLEANGLGEIWYGLLVSADSIEILTGHMAVLVEALPCEATPCLAAEIAHLLLDTYAPTRLESPPDQDLAAWGELFPEMFASNQLAIMPRSVHNGLATAYWKAVAPPISHPQGWTLPLLSHPGLVNAEFDLSVHLTPANRDNNFLQILERRLAFLDQKIETAFRQNATALFDDLQEQRREVADRYAATLNEETRFFEVGITLALRSEESELEAACEVFEAVLKECGLAVRRTRTAAHTRSAMLETAPLNIPQNDRPLVLPVGEAGQLVHLTPSVAPTLAPTLAALVAPQLDHVQTFVGLSQLRSRYFSTRPRKRATQPCGCWANPAKRLPSGPEPCCVTRRFFNGCKAGLFAAWTVPARGKT